MNDGRVILGSLPAGERVGAAGDVAKRHGAEHHAEDRHDDAEGGAERPVGPRVRVPHDQH